MEKKKIRGREILIAEAQLHNQYKSYSFKISGVSSAEYLLLYARKESGIYILRPPYFRYRREEQRPVSKEEWWVRDDAGDVIFLPLYPQNPQKQGMSLKYGHLYLCGKFEGFWVQPKMEMTFTKNTGRYIFPAGIDPQKTGLYNVYPHIWRNSRELHITREQYSSPDYVDRI